MDKSTKVFLVIVIPIIVFFVVAMFKSTINFREDANNFCKSNGYVSHYRNINDYCYKDDSAKQFLAINCDWLNNCEYRFVGVNQSE